MKAGRQFPVTETTYFEASNSDGLGKDKLIVEVSDTSEGFAWRLCVNGSLSNWCSYYHGILVHEGYGLASAYWDGNFKEFVPFQITNATPVK